MAVFYISRHGQTENNKNRWFSGWVDTPLTDEGIKNAHETAAKLRGRHFDQIHSSDLGRAFVTAYIIARDIGFTDEILRSKMLREVSYGDVGGMLMDEAHAIYPGLDAETNFVAPNGESLHQMQQRVLAYLNDLNGQHPDQTILLVAHGGVIDAISANFMNIDLGSHVANTGIGSKHDFVAKFTIKDCKIVAYDEVV
jgi:broad specificity phosphatase PhoE